MAFTRSGVRSPSAPPTPFNDLAEPAGTVQAIRGPRGGPTEPSGCGQYQPYLATWDSTAAQLALKLSVEPSNSPAISGGQLPPRRSALLGRSVRSPAGLLPRDQA